MSVLAVHPYAMHTDNFKACDEWFLVKDKYDKEKKDRILFKIPLELYRDRVEESWCKIGNAMHKPELRMWA